MQASGETSRSSPSRLAACVLAACSLSACETVVVSMVEISEVDVFPSSITLMPGESAAASAVVLESSGAEVSGLIVAWTVDDPDVASVSSDGVVDARAPGTTTVRASSEGVSGSAAVRVLAAPDPEPGPDCDLRGRIVIGSFDVPRNAICFLVDVRILGNLHVREGATLEGTRLTVGGRLESNRAVELRLDDSRVYGEVRFERGGDVVIRDTQVDRKLTLRSNLGSITVSDSRIDDALELQDNRGGPFTLNRNTAERLDCRANDPPPVGDGNVVERDDGQCKGL